MPYKIIDAVMARSLQADAAAARARPRFAWIVIRGLTKYPGAFVARMVTDAPAPYILLGHTPAEIHAQLSPGLARLVSVPELFESLESVSIGGLNPLNLL
jgi:hypothetical protein